MPKAVDFNRPRCERVNHLFRVLFGFRFVLCLNSFLILILAAACQAQAQPGAGSSAAANPPAANSTAKPDVPEPDKVVLKVGDVQITRVAFEQYVADLEATQGPADLSRKQMGENYAAMLMLSKIAAADHLDSAPQVQHQLAIDRMQILSNAEFAKLKSDAAPTEQAISAYYNSHLDDYDVVELRRIFIWPSATNGGKGLTTEQATKLADGIRQVFQSGGDFSRIQKLVHDTPHTIDDVTVDDQPLTFQRGEMPAHMNEAAFSLKAGGWTEMHDSPGVYVFLQAVKRSRKDLTAVKAQIEQKLQAQKLKERVESLKKQMGVWLDESYFPAKPTIPAMMDRD